MSTDIELLNDLSKIGLLTFETRTTAQVSEDISGDVVFEPQKDDDDECRTPTSKEYKVPEILVCPPAPRKPRSAPTCKRKPSVDLQFFEIVNREEVDAFFRSSFENVSGITSVKIRSCCPCK
ncbi:hypothetical protein I3760_02G169100 [Carya illinoinensis]|nr:hypothetical protein I3760_02G169100 [Carya illinoinensis]KAG2723395.1 hypothetical protein I3760_02G169100 [Carya illinoinensis]